VGFAIAVIVVLASRRIKLMGTIDINDKIVKLQIREKWIAVFMEMTTKGNDYYNDNGNKDHPIAVKPTGGAHPP